MAVPRRKPGGVSCRGRAAAEGQADTSRAGAVQQAVPNPALSCAREPIHGAGRMPAAECPPTRGRFSSPLRAHQPQPNLATACSHPHSPGPPLHPRMCWKYGASRRQEHQRRCRKQPLHPPQHRRPKAVRRRCGLGGQGRLGAIPGARGCCCGRGGAPAGGPVQGCSEERARLRHGAGTGHESGPHSQARPVGGRQGRCGAPGW